MDEKDKEQQIGDQRLKGIGKISDVAQKIAKAVEESYERGHPSAITEQKIIDLLHAVLVGNYVETACKYARIPLSTYYKWVGRGEAELKRALLENENGKRLKFIEKEEPYVDLMEAIEQASAQSEMSAVVAIRNGFKDNPKIAIEFLERRHRDRWHKKVELAGDPDNPLNVRVYLPDNGRGPRPITTEKDDDKDE